MNTELIVILTIAACFAVFIGTIYICIFITKHGMTGAALQKVDTGLTFASGLATAIKPFIPAVADNAIELALKYAQQGVTRAEATYKAALATGTTAADTRAAEVQTWVNGSLAMEGVTVTPDMQKLISAVIPIFVAALPKTHTDIAA